MRNTEYKTERKRTWRQPRLGRQILDLLSCLPSPQLSISLRWWSPRRVPGQSRDPGGVCLGRKTVGKRKIHCVVALRDSKRGCGSVGFLKPVPHFPFFTLSLQLLFFLLLFFLSFCPPLRFDHTTRRPREGKRKALPPPPESKRQPPALPPEPGWGCHLVPGARPVFLSQTVLTTLDQGIFAPLSPCPRPGVCCNPGPLEGAIRLYFILTRGPGPWVCPFSCLVPAAPSLR